MPINYVIQKSLCRLKKLSRIYYKIITILKNELIIFKSMFSALKASSDILKNLEKKFIGERTSIRFSEYKFKNETVNNLIYLCRKILTEIIHDIAVSAATQNLHQVRRQINLVLSMLHRQLNQLVQLKMCAKSIQNVK